MFFCGFCIRSANVLGCPLSKETATVGLSSGDSVSGSFSASSAINFQVTDPNGNILVTYDRIVSTSFSFSASMTGTYTMTFDNSFSLITSKTVTLDYSVHPAVAGVPENTWLPTLLLIGIVAFVVFLLIVIVFVGVAVRHSRARQGISNSPVASNRVLPTKSCPVCNKPISSGNNFCPHCAADLRGSNAQPPTSP